MSLSRKPSHSCTLFVRDDGSPMRFYARPGPVKRQLSSLIMQGGGVMCRVQEPGVLLLAQPGEAPGPEYISTEYVKESVRLDQQLDVEDYRLYPGPQGSPHIRDGGRGGRGKRPGNDGEVQEHQHDGGVQGGEEHLKDGEGYGGKEQQGGKGQAGEEHKDGGVPGAEEHQDRGVHGAEEHQDGGVQAAEEHQDGGVLAAEEHQDGGVLAAEEHQGGGVLAAEEHQGGGVLAAEEHQDGGVQGAEEHQDGGVLAAEEQKGGGVLAAEEHQGGGVLAAEEHQGGGVLAAEEHQDRGVHGAEEHQEGVVQGAEEHQDRGVQGAEEHQERGIQGAEELQLVREVHHKDSSSSHPEESEEHLVKQSGVIRHPKKGQSRTEEKQEMTKIGTEKSSDGGDADDHGRTEAPDFTPILPLGRRPFTKEEDMAILDYVRRHVPRRGNVSGVRLWQEMEEKRVLDRTWQSMKSRHKFYLAESRDAYRPASSRSPQKNKITKNSESASPKGLTPELSSTSPERRTSREKRAGKFSLMSPPKTVHSKKRSKDGEKKDDGPGDLCLVKDDTDCGAALQPSTLLAGTMNDSCAVQELPEAETNTDSEDLHIFEIANLEFQSDVSPVEVTPTKRSPGLKEFVTEEDSISQASMTQVDEVSSSPDVSEGEGLQNALLDMMSEFSLTLCDVTQALLKNNGEVGSTRHFLRTGSRPDGYPIWVRKDDLDLEEEDPTSHERLVQKYGAENVAKRMAFLAS